jgi:CPA2 family monovalent cation:H+ antiporter-2
MHEITILKDLVVVLGAGVVVVALLRRLRVPSIAGFILTGVLAGPTALGLVGKSHDVEVLAEVGVILLLFGIGLELSLERIKRLWQAILVGGSIQVGITAVATALIARAFGMETGAAAFLGCVVAVSSTAVVLRGLAARGELETPHGRLAVGILVFQDLCVVPMILAVPLLAGQGGSLGAVAATMGSALGILVGVLLAASLVVPRLLALVARTRQRDLFVLTVFLVCFGIAWLVSRAGISLALGAFLAGLVVAGSEFRHQAMSDLIPLREILASLFFVSVGMLLDVGAVAADPGPALGLLAAVMAGKFIIILLTALLLRLPLRVAILSAAALSQVGEFSFVLLGAARGTGLLDPALSNNLLTAIILSMLLTPLGLAFGPHLALSASRVGWLNRRLGAEPPGIDTEEPHADHVVVAGYGLAGREVCRALRERGVPCLVVDTNADNVREARGAGEYAVLGDVTQDEVLEEVGVAHARLVIVNINDHRATELALRRLREMAPHTPVVVRTQYDMDRDGLLEAGATRVIAAEAVAGAALAGAAVELAGDGERS